jgi:hypothetical protein
MPSGEEGEISDMITTPLSKSGMVNGVSSQRSHRRMEILRIHVREKGKVDFPGDSRAAHTWR